MEWTLVVMLVLTHLGVGCTQSCPKINRVAVDSSDNHDDSKACSHSSCKRIASEMMLNMDFGADPCTDFRRFACGNFPFNHLDEEGIENLPTDPILRDILEKPITTNSAEYTRKMRMFYQSCGKKAEIESLGLTPYNTSKFAKMWPSINQNWNSSQFDILQSLVTYARVFVQPFIRVYTERSTNDKLILRASQPEFTILPERLVSNDSNFVIEDFRKQYVAVATLFGANNATAVQDAEDYIALERQMAEILTLNYKLSSLSLATRIKVYPPDGIAADVKETFITKSFQEFGEKYTRLGLNYSKVAESIISNARVSVPSNQSIDIHEEYFDQVTSILLDATPRVVQNILGYRHVLTILKSLSKEARELVNNEGDVDCLELTRMTFAHGLSKRFVATKLKTEVKREVLEMFEKLRQTGISIVNSSSLLEDPRYKQRLLDRLRNITLKINVPEHDFTSRYLKNFYRYVDMEGDFYANYGETRKLPAAREFVEAITGQSAEPRWGKHRPDQRRVSYDSVNLRIEMTPGYFVTPTFTTGNYHSLNYGALGYLIGHHFMRALDLLRFPFTDISIQAFDKGCLGEKLNCYAGQYIAYARNRSEPSSSTQTTKELSQGDGEGLNLAFRAYQSVKRPENDHPLFGLNLTTNQQLFVSFAQHYCYDVPYGEDAFQIATTHDFRVFNAIQNNVDFANAFSCPPNTTMNPTDKCFFF